jgi:hypothetical protein
MQPEATLSKARHALTAFGGRAAALSEDFSPRI